MPNLTGQPALDTAIGLFFLFFLLSVICSAINETIASALALRSEYLLDALQSMLKSDHDPSGTAASNGPASPPRSLVRPGAQRGNRRWRPDSWSSTKSLRAALERIVDERAVPDTVRSRRNAGAAPRLSRA